MNRLASIYPLDDETLKRMRLVHSLLPPDRKPSFEEMKTAFISAYLFDIMTPPEQANLS
jgi:hypothetical protein